MDDLRELSRSLTTQALGRMHEHHDTLVSTNDRASAWAREGAPHGALVTADHQTAGRGRRGRTWFSPAGENLYASVVLRPDAAPPDIGAAALAVGVGLREGLQACGASVQLKWPNDLLCGGRKLGGILCECRWTDGVPELVVGFGINVRQAAFDPSIEDIATSLVLQGVPSPSRTATLATVLGTLEACLSVFFERGFAAIADRYTRHCPMLGSRVELDDDASQSGRRREVIAEGLEADGSLRVRDPVTGEQQRIQSTDVYLPTP